MFWKLPSRSSRSSRSLADVRIDVKIPRDIHVVHVRLGSQAEHPEQHRVRRQDAPLRRTLIDPFQYIFKQSAEALLGPAQSLFGALALGDVGHHGEHAEKFAGPVGEGIATSKHPRFTAVFTAETPVALFFKAATEVLKTDSLDRKILRKEEFFGLPADD